MSYIGNELATNAYQTLLNASTQYVQLFSGTGAQVNFTLTAVPGNLNAIEIDIGGVAQVPGVDYTWGGGTSLTFTTAPITGTNNIHVRFSQTLPVGTPADGSVSVQKLNQALIGGEQGLITSLSGTNTITGTVTGITSYSIGQSFNFVAVGTNTGAVTININGIGAVALTKSGSTVLYAGDIQIGSTVQIMYDGTQFQLTSGAGGVTNAPPFAFKNLQASATGLSATVSVTADEVALANSANFYFTARAVSLSISGASSGVANGLDTGTLAASTWYSVWVISDGTTKAGLLSLSATAPTMPSGYTFKARVGWISTDSSGNKYPLGFKQYGRTVQYIIGTGNLTSSPMIVSGVQGAPTTPTWVAASISTFVPTTAAAIRISLFLLNANATYAILAPNNNYGSANSATVPPPLSVGFSGTSIGGNFVLTTSLILESTNIYYACNSGQGGATCLGWEDNL